LRLVTGRLSITTEFSQEETAKLHRLRYLTEGELEDRDRIAEAIHALLGNIADDL
jgi:signal transduction histidine kinase